MRVVVPTRTERTKTMYCGTCDRRRFIKTFREGIVAVIEFEGATNRQTFELAQEDEAFKDWTCARCRHEIGNDFMMRALDEKLEQWCAKKDLCTVTGNFQRV